MMMMMGVTDVLDTQAPTDSTRTLGQQSYGSGICCWTELRTADVARALAFYSELFGWTVRHLPVAPSESYTVLEVEGVAVAGVSTASADESTRPHWRLYTAITNRATPVVARASEVVDLHVHVDAPKLPKLVRSGRWAAPGKPLGALFAASRAELFFREVEPSPPAVIWMDLNEEALLESAAFCCAFFERTGEAPEHTGLPLLLANEEPGAPTTGLTLLAAPTSALPAWSAGFAVRDLDETIRRALSLGARVAAPPETLERLGRAAAIVDPLGATFVCWQPSLRTSVGPAAAGSGVHAAVPISPVTRRGDA